MGHGCRLGHRRDTAVVAVLGRTGRVAVRTGGGGQADPHRITRQRRARLLGDIRGEALWDFLTLWTLLAAGVLLILDNRAWAYFGLVGGGMYVYFAGRGILTRLEMQRRGFRIGKPQNVGTAYIFLAVWGAVGLVTIIAAVVALS